MSEIDLATGSRQDRGRAGGGSGLSRIRRPRAGRPWRVELAHEARCEVGERVLGQQAAGLVVVDPREHPPDGDAVRGHGDHPDLVAHLDRPRPQHTGVRTRSPRLGEPAHPPGLADSIAERLARDARGGDLQAQRTPTTAAPAHLQDGADLQLRGVDTGHAQVLAEVPGRDRPTELGLPRLDIGVGEQVDGLPHAAVMLAVGLDVAVEAVLTDLHRALDGALVDRRHADAAGNGEELVHHADGLHGERLRHRRPGRGTARGRHQWPNLRLRAP